MSMLLSSLNCKNRNRCYLLTKSHPLGEYCKKSKHANCDSIDPNCNKVAIFGPANSSDRTYCKECFNQMIHSGIINDRESYTINNNKCVECKEDFARNGYCYRSYDATNLPHITRTPAFSCKNCVPIICERNSFQLTSMISVKAGACEMVNDQGELICSKQGSKKLTSLIDGVEYISKFCAAHLNELNTMNDNKLKVSPKSACIVCKEIEPIFAISSSDSNKATHCLKCAKESKQEYKDVKHTLCAFEGCPKRATFGVEKNKPKWCSEHAKSQTEIDAINVTDVCNKMCESCGKLRASFKDENGRYKWCMECFNEQMVQEGKPIHVIKRPEPKVKTQEELDVINERKRIANLCITCAQLLKETPDFKPKCKVYNVKGGAPKYCIDHRNDDMVNGVTRSCGLCYKSAIFGTENQEPILRCGEHVCPLDCSEAHDECTKLAKRLSQACTRAPEGTICRANCSFGYRDSKTNKLFFVACKKHSDDTMILVRHDLCKYQDKQGLFVCDLRSTFGIKGQSPERCFNHKLPNHVDTHHIICNYNDELNGRCSSRACYGFIDVRTNHKGRALKCFEHREAYMVNVVKPLCIECGFRRQLSSPENQSKFNHMCRYCFLGLDKVGNDIPEAVKQFNQKEHMIRKLLMEHPCIKSNENISRMAFDKRVGGACARRPDMLFEVNDTHYVIVEVDEKQHSRHSYEEEEARIMEIQYALKSIPLVVIRFNPDTYQILLHNGVVRNKNPLFKKNKLSGLIEPRRESYLSENIEILAKTLNDAINTIPDCFIQTVYLRFTSDELLKSKGKH